MEGIEGIGGILFGYGFTRVLSHPNYNLKLKLPNIRFKAVEILPNLKIRLKRHILHIHHWIFLSAIFGGLIIASSSFTQLLLVKSFCLGGIIQGVCYKDRFRILIKI